MPRAREDISFGYEILAVTERWGLARWHGAYTPVEGEAHVELDGILMLSLDDEGRCRDFREWSNRRPDPVGSHSSGASAAVSGEPNARSGR